MSYRAVSDRIVLIPEKLDGKIDGIIIPDSSKDKPKSGTVESVGPLCKEAKPGYKILFLVGHGATFTEDGVDKLILKESDVLCMEAPDIDNGEDSLFMIKKTGDDVVEITKIKDASWNQVFQAAIKLTL